MKLEEEAAGIALATEEEYTQYQQLKQVQLLVSVPWVFLEVDTSSGGISCALTSFVRSGTLSRPRVHKSPIAEHQGVEAFHKAVRMLCWYGCFLINLPFSHLLLTQSAALHHQSYESQPSTCWASKSGVSPQSCCLLLLQDIARYETVMLSSI